MIVICIVVAFLLALAGTYTHRAASLGYVEGQKAALKVAIEAVKERGDVAILVAPRGLLRDGYQRAHTAHQIEMDLRQLLARVR